MFFVDYRVEDDKLFLQRTPEEREPLLARLKRIEGQVRGLQQMIQADRYCGDELQQIAALQAALREVALMLTEQHVATGLDRILQSGDVTEGVDEIKAVLRAALRQR